MSLRGDERGQSIQIGMAILLAFIVLAMASYQATVVPDQNRQVEYNHNQQVQSQMSDLRSTVVSAPGGGSGGSVTIQLGTTYPERTFFVNPGPPTGQLRTSPARNLTITNAAAPAAETDDFWNGGARNYSTRALVYRPNYHVLTQEPETVYENTVLYDRYRSGASTQTVVDTDQKLVDGKTLTVVTLEGEYQEATMEARSVDLSSVSTSTRTITVKNTSNPITIVVPTRLSTGTWNSELLDDEPYATASPGPRPDTVTITLDQGVTYRLRMAKVGVGTNVDDPAPAYLTTKGAGGKSIPENTTTEVVVEVRDEFNNPVAGASVNASTARGDSSVKPLPDDVTDADGQVTLVYEAPKDVTASQVTDRINVSFATSNTGVATFNGSAPENVSVEMTVRDDDGGGGGGGSNTLGWNTTQIELEQGVTGCSGGRCTYNRSQDPDSTLPLTANTSPARSFVNVDFSTNFSTVVSGFSPSENATGPDGETVTDATISNRGTAEVYASSASGDATLVLEVVSSGGGSNTPPTADPNGPYSVDEGNSVPLDGTGSNDPDGSIASYQWQITSDPTGAASLSNANTATPTFDAPTDVSTDRTVQVELTVTDDQGATHTDTTTVDVYETNNQPPTADPGGPYSVNESNSLTLDGSSSSDPDDSVVSYRWRIVSDPTGGASLSNVNSATPTFDAPTDVSSATNVTVELEVEDKDGAKNTETVNVTVEDVGNLQPYAAFSYSPTAPNTSETVTFDASASYDPSSTGSIASYEWDFDGDGTTDATGEVVSTSYSGAGERDVTLTVTDNEGATNSTTKTVSVQNRPPAASIIADKTTVNTSETVTFDASGSSDPDGTITEYRWDFDGDGTVDTTTVGPTVTHSYADDDAYAATVTVVDNDTATDSASVTVTVENRPPSASFTFSPTSPGPGETVTFDAAAATDPDGSIQSYSWEFGDGTSTSGPSATADHLYSTPGSYTVNLTVTDDDGATTTVSQTIFVSATTYVSDYNDGPGSNTALPPKKPVGYVYLFDRMQAEDDSYGYLYEEDTNPSFNEKYEMDVGFLVDSIPSAPNHVLDIDVYASDGEDIELEFVDASGNEITTITLSVDPGQQTLSVSLPTSVVDYINNNGQLYFVAHDTYNNDGTQTIYYVDYIRVNSTG